MQTSTQARDVRKSFLTLLLSELHHHLLLHVKVEIKTATTEKTINEAKVVLQKVAANDNRVLFSSHFDDELYKILVASTHRTQQRNNISLLGLTAALYIKSSSSKIIYTCVDFYSTSVRMFHNDQLTNIVSPLVMFLYKKLGTFNIPSLQDNKYKHRNYKTRVHLHGAVLEVCGHVYFTQGPF